MKAEVIYDQMSEKLGTTSRVGEIVEVICEVKSFGNLWTRISDSDPREFSLMHANKDIWLVKANNSRYITKTALTEVNCIVRTKVNNEWLYGNDIYSKAELKLLEETIV